MFSTLMFCGCPVSDTLETIPVNGCIEYMGQLQRDFYSTAAVSWDTATPANNLPATIAGEVIEDFAGWNILITANLVVYTPLINGTGGIAAGAAVTRGGGEDSLNGQVQYISTDPATVTRMFTNLTAEQIAAYRDLECRNRNTPIYVTWAAGDGALWAWKKDGIITGIPISGFNVGTKVNVGRTDFDSNTVTYQIPADYDEYLVRITPSDWNALKQQL